MVKGGKKQACATIHDECKFPTKKLRALKRPVLSHKVDLIKQGCENSVVKQMSKSWKVSYLHSFESWTTCFNLFSYSRILNFKFEWAESSKRSRSYASALRQITYYAKTHFKIFLRSLNCGITVSLDIFVSVAISGCVFKLASDAWQFFSVERG